MAKEEMNKEDSKIWCASFDIGKKNFSFYIEEMDKSALLKLPCIQKSRRYNADGTTAPPFGRVMKKLCVNGKAILFKNTDLTVGCVKSKYLDPEVYHNMTDLLDSYKEYWDKCEAFVIEQQMSFGRRHNTMALKLGQHCYSYFAFHYSRFKTIIEFPSYHKTQVLGAQKIQRKTKKGKITYKAIDKPARKKWSIQKCLDILAERGDFETMSMLTSQKKKDDLADCLTMLQAWKFLTFVDRL